MYVFQIAKYCRRYFKTIHHTPSINNSKKKKTPKRKYKPLNTDIVIKDKLIGVM